MFSNLVESGSHAADRARRSSFFIGTLICYSLLLVTTGVASVYTYKAQLDDQNLELVEMISPAPLPAENTHADTPHTANSARNNNISKRTELIAPLATNIKPPDTISTKPNNVPEMPRWGTVMISDRNSDADLPSGPTGPAGPAGNNAAATQPRVIVAEGTDIPPPVKATPTPAPKMISLPSNIISSKVLSKPVPAYPIIAKQAHIYGVVMVEILIDEQGRVISAQATSGHPLLREAARQAALQARFTPTQLNGQTVKVSGVITYNFVLQ
jgi:protein TonB